jgi:dUTP pyrophosphatase
MNIEVKKLHPQAILPSRAHYDDAGLDLCLLHDLTLAPGEKIAAETGITLAIPTGHVGLVWDKSSIPFKYDIKTMGGVIDAQYRGEVKVLLINLGKETISLEAGSKIAQLLIQKVELSEVQEVDELTETVRGEAGFGSTGIK